MLEKSRKLLLLATVIDPPAVPVALVQDAMTPTVQYPVSATKTGDGHNIKARVAERLLGLERIECLPSDDTMDPKHVLWQTEMENAYDTLVNTINPLL